MRLQFPGLEVVVSMVQNLGEVSPRECMRWCIEEQLIR